ncbi:MAG: SRPBCC domain-containing protein [Sediminibacterium sp.]
MQTEPIVMERIYNAPINTVWNAISNKEEMKKWYFDLAEFKPEPGFEFSFLAGEKDKEYLHLCRITEVIPGKKLSYTWRYDGYEGDSEVSFELFAEGDTTKLILTHIGLETFPSQKDPAFKKENFVAGWTHILNTSLKDFLEH